MKQVEEFVTGMGAVIIIIMMMFVYYSCSQNATTEPTSVMQDSTDTIERNMETDHVKRTCGTEFGRHLCYSQDSTTP